jgi:hypothetical protein
MHCANLYGNGQTRVAVRWDCVLVPAAPQQSRDPWLRRMDAERGAGYTGMLEIICFDCGDNPYLGYYHVLHRLPKGHGPYAMADGIAACEKHQLSSLPGPAVTFGEAD